MANSAADPAYRAQAVTPSDSTVVDARALYIGGAGDVVLKCRSTDNTATFVGVPAGTILPVKAYFVMAATTATNIVALY